MRKETTMSQILIVEDERKIARFVELELKHEGYQVFLADDGKAGLDFILNQKPDLVVLDVMLPSMNGIEICKTVREQGITVPIIMLTAKDDVMDKVEGLDNGADDYMTKPFAIEELLARIRVALKHKDSHETAQKNPCLQHGNLIVDLDKYTVKYKEDLIALTKKEFDLLAFLLKNKNKAISRDAILNKVWNYDYVGETNVVDVYVRYIRQKIDDQYHDKILQTVRGVGYIIKDE